MSRCEQASGCAAEERVVLAAMVGVATVGGSGLQAWRGRRRRGPHCSRARRGGRSPCRGPHAVFHPRPIPRGQARREGHGLLPAWRERRKSWRASVGRRRTRRTTSAWTHR